MSHTKKQLDKAFLLRALVTALAVFLAAHAFCYFNLSLRGSSLMLNAEKTNSSAIIKGQVLQPFYWRLRGGISSPFLIGLLSFLYLFGAALILSRLFRIRKTVPFAVFCCILFISPALLELNVSSLFTADAVCLAFLLMTAGSAVLLAPDLLPWPAVLRMLLGFLLLCGGTCLAPDLSNIFVCIAAVYALSRCLAAKDAENAESAEEAAQPLRPAQILSAFIVYAAALGASLAVMLFFCRRTGSDLEVRLIPADGRSYLTSLALPFTSLFVPVTIYPVLLPVVRIILLGAGLFGIIKHPRAALFVLLLVPAMVFPVLGTGMQQFPFQLIFLDIACLMLIMRIKPGQETAGRIFRYVLRGAYAVLFIGCLVFFNHAYLKVNLDFQTSLAVVTQIISRLEDRDDFRPPATQVAFLGSLADSPLVAIREGFEHLRVLRALDGNTSLTDPSQLTWYFWETLGYPMNCLSDYEQEQFASLPEVESIPVFPHPESIRPVGETLVIRLSE